MNSIYHHEVLAVLDKVGGTNNARRFLGGELVLVRPELLARPVWKTIRVGRNTNFKSAFGREGYSFEFTNCDTWFLENQIPRMSPTKTEVDLVNMSTFELGFEHSPDSLAEVCNRAKAIGLEVCHPEIVPELRLQYLEQDQNEVLWVPIDTSIKIPSDSKGEWLPVVYDIHGLWGKNRFGMSSIRTWDIPRLYRGIAPLNQQWVFVKLRPQQLEQRAEQKVLNQLTWEI